MKAGLCALAFCCAVSAVWPAVGENNRVYLVRAAFCSGGQGKSEGHQVQIINTIGHAAATPQNNRAFLYPNFLAPATDPTGLVTATHVREILLGQKNAPDPVAIDFAGNRDGRVNIADVIALTNKQLP